MPLLWRVGTAVRKVLSDIPRSVPDRTGRGACRRSARDQRRVAGDLLEVDDYLAGLDEANRIVLKELRRTVLEIIPDAEQCIAYGSPAFKGGQNSGRFRSLQEPPQLLSPQRIGAFRAP